MKQSGGKGGALSLVLVYILSGCATTGYELPPEAEGQFASVSAERRKQCEEFARRKAGRVYPHKSAGTAFKESTKDFWNRKIETSIFHPSFGGAVFAPFVGVAAAVSQAQENAQARNDAYVQAMTHCMANDLDLARADTTDTATLHERPHGNDQEKWRRLCRAAELGSTRAQLRLATMFRWGEAPVTEDLRLAYMWYALADRNGEPLAASVKERLTGYMTPSQIAEAEDMVANWKPGECVKHWPSGSGSVTTAETKDQEEANTQTLGRSNPNTRNRNAGGTPEPTPTTRAGECAYHYATCDAAPTHF